MNKKIKIFANLVLLILFFMGVMFVRPNSVQALWCSVYDGTSDCGAAEGTCRVGADTWTECKITCDTANGWSQACVTPTGWYKTCPYAPYGTYDYVACWHIEAGGGCSCVWNPPSGGYYCGDGLCTGSETHDSCPTDCPPPPPPPPPQTNLTMSVTPGSQVLHPGQTINFTITVNKGSGSPITSANVGFTCPAWPGVTCSFPSGQTVNFGGSTSGSVVLAMTAAINAATQASWQTLQTTAAAVGACSGTCNANSSFSTMVSWTGTDNSSCGGFTNIPDTIPAGSTFTGSITMNNTGTSVWRSATVNGTDPIRLGSYNHNTGLGDNTTWGTGRIAPSQNYTYGGQQGVYTYTFTAPAVPGTYPFDWKMVHDGVAWFGAYCAKNIVVGVAASPDLIANKPAENTATAGISRAFTSNITNIGTASTGGGFTNLFQTSPVSDGSSGVVDYPAPGMPALAANGTAITSQSITFPTAGTMYIRTCADKSSAGNTGVIAESNEGNNCSGWGPVTINPPSPIVVTLTATPPSLILPANSTNLAWTTTGSPTSCSGTGPAAWVGAKNIAGGNQTMNGLTTGTYTYNITCSKAGVPDATAQAVVTVAPAPPVPVNGACGGPTGTCNAGTPTSTTDNGCYISWRCLGSNGGLDSPLCSTNKSNGTACTGGGTCNGAGVCLVPVALTVIKAGQGNVTSSPSGINCGSDCTENYNTGDTIVLTATPLNSTRIFTGWSGCDSSTKNSDGSGGTCTVVMDPGGNSVTANFAVNPNYKEF